MWRISTLKPKISGNTLKNFKKKTKQSTENQKNTKNRNISYVDLSCRGMVRTTAPVSYATDHRRWLLNTLAIKGKLPKKIHGAIFTTQWVLKDKSETIFLMTTDGKVYVSYLVNIFEKVCSLKHGLSQVGRALKLQKANATLGNAKAKTFGFVTFLSLCRSNILSKSYVQFSWLKDCDVIK